MSRSIPWPGGAVMCAQHIVRKLACRRWSLLTKSNAEPSERPPSVTELEQVRLALNDRAPWPARHDAVIALRNANALGIIIRSGYFQSLNFYVPSQTKDRWPPGWPDEWLSRIQAEL